MPQDSQAISDLLLEFWNTGNTQLADEIYTSTSVQHAPDHTARGTQEIVNYATQTRAAFPDFKIVREQRISEGDLTVMRWTASGTHKGEFNGVPATGRWVETSGVTITQIENGRIANEFVYYDRLRLLEQLGVARLQGEMMVAER